jgi:AraC-like DNA-binding protein
LSATKLKSGFKALFGKSISHFANELRMQHALELLRKSDSSILLVAETLGYEYQNSFTVAFRRHFNVLPKDYRRDPMVLDGAILHHLCGNG